MRPLRALIDPGGGSLAFHVERLRQTLDGLAGRLRAALAQAVGAAVSGAVREAIHAVLTAEENHPESDATHIPRRPEPLSPLWGDPEEERPYGEYAPSSARFAEDDGCATGPALAPGRRPARPATWREAVAVGLRAAAWWLLSRPGRYAPLVALGVGGAGTRAVLAGGTVAAAAAGLLASMLGLTGPGGVVLRLACSALAVFSCNP